MVLLPSHRHRNGGSPLRTRGSYCGDREERRGGAMTPKSTAAWIYARFRGRVINTEQEKIKPQQGGSAAFSKLLQLNENKPRSTR